MICAWTFETCALGAPGFQVRHCCFEGYPKVTVKEQFKACQERFRRQGLVHKKLL